MFGPQSHLKIPAPSQPVIDAADLLTPNQELAIATLARSLQSHPGPEVVVWTFDSLRGEPIEGLGIRAADEWQLGDRDRDDGLILLIAKNDRQLRIEVGQGLEGVLPDVLAFRQIEGILVPALRQQRPAQGIVEWIQDVGQRAAPGWQPDPQLAIPRSLVGGTQASPLQILGFIVLLVLLSVLRGGRRAFGGYRGSPWGRTGGWGGGSGWTSGGGWGGGGGGFSGGGSSGRW